MIEKVINLSLKQPLLIVIVFFILGGFGIKSWQDMPVDAIPDLSDVQVIVKVSYEGRTPDLIEQQVTYPLSTLFMSVPGSETVRGYSFFGEAYIYVIFSENTDLYWARSRVQEYLAQAQGILPDNAELEMGPDASGVGWVFQYVLRDTLGNHHLGDLTRLQDWFIRQELQSVAGVSQVAKVGGMTQTYQVVVDPFKLHQFGITTVEIESAINQANNEVGGAVIELAEAEYMVRSGGFLKSINDFEQIALGVSNNNGTPLFLRDVATIRLGPSTRRGVADWNGQGEVVGGVVVMRDGANALRVINNVKDTIRQIQTSLPQGVVIETAYDRSGLIKDAISYLNQKLLEEMILVILVCGAFLWHFRASLIIAMCLPLAVLFGFILMRQFNVNANLMSLGGIAIAMGAIVDAAIVMVENVQKQREIHHKNNTSLKHYLLVKKACKEVGPALFVSLVIITVSFLPIFSLEGQEGKLFTPLAYTKTFVMFSAAVLSITLVPVLSLFMLKGRVTYENKNPLSVVLQKLYRPWLSFSLRWPWVIVFAAIMTAASSIYPMSKLGSEFMPNFNEGDLLYMPTTLPGVSVQQAAKILQQTDAIIKTVPEVKSVFGKAGRAETATDPAPLSMFETTIQLHPKHQWREGVDLENIVAELNAKVNFPGLTNSWGQPIKTRIDMLSTGVKTSVAVKIYGSDLTSIQNATAIIERSVEQVAGTVSVIGDRPLTGRYIDIVPNRLTAARYGLTISDIHAVVEHAIGGQTIGETIQGRERFPINVRYPRIYRSDIQRLKELPFKSESGVWLSLSQVADIRIVDGPSVIKSENARSVGWVYIDIESDIALSDYITDLEKELTTLKLPQQVTWAIAGEYENLQRVENKLKWIIPVVLAIIFVLLHWIFKSLWQALLVMLSLPIALSGAIWSIYWLDYQLSVALVVGIIALLGVAAEFSVVMLVYLNSSWRSQVSGVDEKIRIGACQRVRPKAMTVITILAGLLPLMIGQGAGSEIMQRIAAPIVGGMIVCPLISMLFIPAVYKIIQVRKA